MTSTDLQTLTHEDLVEHVRARITGAPTASTYLRKEGVPGVRIQTYPKRRRPNRDRQTVRWVTGGAPELTYADFLDEPRRVALTA